MKMVHPEIEAVGEVLNKEQFNLVWAPRGWTLLDEATSYANDNLGRFVRSADELTKDEARALIAVKGGEYPDADASEDEVKALYSDQFGPHPARPAPATESATGVPIKLYDPSEHPVNASADGSDQGVLAYLESADDDERQRVLELEEAGQGRTTILNWSPPDTDSTPVDNENKE